MKNWETLFDEKKPYDNVWREMADKNGAGRCFITGRVAVRQTHVHVGCVHVKRWPVKFGAKPVQCAYSACAPSWLWDKLQFFELEGIWRETAAPPSDAFLDSA